MRKNKKYRFIGILVISLTVLTLISFFAMRKIGSSSLSFSRKERFFLNGTLNKNVDEIITELGEPDRITEYAGIYVYQDFKLKKPCHACKFKILVNVYPGVFCNAVWFA